VLRAVPSIGAIHLLAAAPPPDWAEGWLRDAGQGLNPELEAARGALGPVPLLVIHADLPLVSPEDVAALLGHAEARGCALAPDRHGEGTNAVALAPGRALRFAFGPGSFALHDAQAGDAARVDRPGLALDCDTPDDLDRAIAAGFVLPG
jgi:2-phospho-L-lactate guanylyltransferase